MIENGEIPNFKNNYDLIFSSFVLFEMKTKEQMKNYLSKAKKTMNQAGIFISVTGSEELYSASRNWLTAKANNQPNRKLKSGDPVKLYVPEANIEFSDYYWTEKDYRTVFTECGFNLLEVIYPLGNENESYPWKDEIRTSPFIILIAAISSEEHT